MVRGRRRLLMGFVLGALIAAAVVGVVVFERRDPDRTNSAPIIVPDGLQVGFAPITGVRVGAPTVVSGTVANTGSSALPVAFSIDALPTGANVANVLPTSSSSSTGGWSCSGNRCTWADASGAPLLLAPESTAAAMIALSAPASASGSGFVVAVDGLAPTQVTLDLPGGAPALGNDAISVDLAAPSTLLMGTPTTASARVTNLASTSIAPGALTLSIGAPTVPGLTSSANGVGWSCTTSSCVNVTSLPPLTVTPAVQISMTTSATATAAQSELAVTAVATSGGQSSTSTATHQINVSPPRSVGVSTRLELDRASVVEGSEVIASITAIATGNGVLADPVTLSLDLPRGLAVDWSAASIVGPWACTDDGCSSTGALVSGEITTIAVPISIAVGTRPGTFHLATSVTVGSGDDATAQTPAPATVVVVAPPAASLRAAIRAEGASDPHGGAIGFTPGTARTLVVTVTDEGSSPVRSGATVHLIASPTHEETVRTSGGSGWSCAPSSGTVSADRPLECTQRLNTDLAPGSTLSMPFTLEPGTAGDNDWMIGVGESRAAALQTRSHARVSVLDHAPRFATTIVAGSPLHDGGSGQLIVEVVNHGDVPAAGGVAVIAVPEKASIVAVYAPAWNCLIGDLSGANGAITCSTSSVVAPGSRGPSISLDVAVVDHPELLEFSAWASAVGQFDEGRRGATQATFPVASALVVEAGPDLTVVTPQTMPDGTVAPAVVQLVGTADLASATSLVWTQLCTTPGSQGCGTTTSPTVAWIGVPPDRSPTTVAASFTAPEISGPEDLYFRLTGTVGSSSISDDMVVHLIPAASTPSAGGGSGGGNGGGSGGGNGVPSPPQPVIAPAPTATIAGSGTVLQVPTRAMAQLVGGGSGVGPLTFAWTQTAGAEASIIGQSASQAVLQLTTPTLAPDDQSESLEFELTVTDSTGATATASIAVEVVWGDGGLLVTIADGAASVVSSVDGPIVIASSVRSRGAPYTYQWQLDGVEVPSGTAVDGPTLAFTAPGSAADGTATLTVTDSFGRVTTVSVALIVSALPPGQLPVAFCDAINSLLAGRSAVVSGDGVQFTIPSATVSTATCAAGTVATFTMASATVPGGLSLAGASGQLTIAGVSISSAQVTSPSNWSLSQLAVAPGGLLAPFSTSTAIGVPTGAITGSSTPFVAPTGWTGTTTITFSSAPTPAAVIAASSQGSSLGAALQITGSANGDGVVAQFRASGLLAIGIVDLPLSGQISTSSTTGAPAFTVMGVIGQPTALAAGVVIASADVSWTPDGAVGDVVLTVGSGAGALVLDSPATIITPATVAFTFPGTQNSWTGSPGSPVMTLTGGGSIANGQLTITAISQLTAPWSIAAQLVIGALQMNVSIDCPVIADAACGPSLTVSASASSPLMSSPIAMSGTFDPSSSVTNLSGSASSLFVAPLTVTSATLKVQLSSDAPPVASASGTATLLGVSAPSEVAFTSSSTTATTVLGALTIAPGWQIPTVTALATTSTTTYSSPVPSSGGPVVSVSVVAGAITGVGITQIPSSLAGQAIPSGASTGLVSFTIGSGPVSAYTLTVPLTSPWYVAGSTGSDVAVLIDSITYSVTVTGQSVTVAIDGTATLTTSMFGSSRAVPLQFENGQLAGGALTATFTPISQLAWTNAFGVQGFTASNLSISLTTTPTGSQVVLSSPMVMPAALLMALGEPATATPVLNTVIGDGTLCGSIDLTANPTSGTNGVDIGGAGLLYSPTAYVVLASQACTAQDAQVAGGVSVLLDGSTIGNVVLPVDLTSMQPTGSISPTWPIDIGGLQLDGATITVSSGAARPRLSIAGSTAIEGTNVPLTGTVVVATGGPGTVELGGDLPSLGIGGFTLTTTTVRVTTVSVLTASPSATSVKVSGSITLLGNTSVASLSGALAGGVITQLQGSIPSATHVVSGADRFTGPLAISYDSTESPTTTVTGTGTLAIAESSSNVRTFAPAAISMVDPTSMAVSASTGFATTALAGTPAATVTVTGPYTLATGAYEFTNSTSANASLAGFTVPSDVVFSRTGGAAVAQQTANFTLGLFDDDGVVAMQGQLAVGPAAIAGGPSTATATFAGEADDQAIRGLFGNASFSVAPSAGPSGTTLYTVSVTFDSTSGGCPIWKSDPQFTGVVYRSPSGSSAGTTLFTLAGSATVPFPGGISPSTFEGAGNQPVVISNESLPNAPSANGFTLSLPINASAFSAVGTISFDFADCALSLAGTAMLQLNGGSAAQELQSALGSQTKPQIQLGSLFQGAELPPSVTVARAMLQAESVAATFATQLADQLLEVGRLNEIVQTNRGLAQAAAQQLQKANAVLFAAQDALEKVETNLELETLAAGYFDDVQQLAAAEDTLPAARQAVADANARVAPVQDAANEAQEVSTQAQNSLTESEATANEAQDAANALEDKMNDASHPTVAQITIDYTHCLTCSSIDTLNLGGQVLFGPGLFEVNLEFGWGEDGLNSLQLTVGGGVEELWQVSAGEVGAYVSGELVATLTVGYNYPGSGDPGWVDIVFTIEGSATVDAYLDTWCCSFSAQLASVVLEGSVQFIPSPAQFNGNFTIQIAMFSFSLTIGPDTW